jgi:hypothetical protein
MDQFNPLSAERSLHINEAGDVAAGFTKARHEPAADRIRDGCKDNRDRAGLALQRRRSWSGYRDKHVGARLHQLVREQLCAIQIAAGPAIFDVDVATINPSQLSKPLTECGIPSLAL